jgi:hypothetical protein
MPGLRPRYLRVVVVVFCVFHRPILLSGKACPAPAVYNVLGAGGRAFKSARPDHS